MQARVAQQAPVKVAQPGQQGSVRVGLGVSVLGGTAANDSSVASSIGTPGSLTRAAGDARWSIRGDVVAVPADYVANLTGGLAALVESVSNSGGSSVARSPRILLTNPDPTAPNGRYDLPVSSTIDLAKTSAQISGLGSGTTLTWTGSAGGDMFNVTDSSRVTLTDMTLMAGTGSSPGAAVHSSAPSASLNEHLTIERVQVGRRLDNDTAATAKFTHGLLIDGTVGNNDQYVVRDFTVHDATTAGIYIGNEQAIWGTLDNLFLNSCATGIVARGSVNGSNWTFNRCGVDLDIQNAASVNVIGHYSEHSGLIWKMTWAGSGTGSRLNVWGGNIVLMSDLTDPTVWCDLGLAASGGGVNLIGVKVVDQLIGSRTAKLYVHASSSDTSPVTLYTRGCIFPNGDSDSGYNIVSYSAGTPLRVDIEQWPYKRRQTVNSTNPAGAVTAFPARHPVGPWSATSTAASQTNVSLTGQTPANTRLMTSAGKITGLRIQTNQARTAGTLTVAVTKNGSVSAVTSVIDGTNTTANGVTYDLDSAPVTFVAGDRIGAVITTTSTWAPTTANLTVEVEVAF